MIVADWIARFLAEQGVTHVFTLSGGMICPMLDAIATLPLERGATAPRIVPMRHEQAAGFAAEGAARMTGIPGVAMATSGPGATNLLTAIASCYFDSTPAVFLTGQVPTHEQRHGFERQRGFQETDIVGMAGPVTKWAHLCRSPEGVPDLLVEAFRIARLGRPGPVLLDLPFDIQRTELRDPISPFVDVVMPPQPAVGDVSGLLGALREAKRPLALVGGGVRAGQAVSEVRRLLSYLWIPTVHSLLGKDVLGAGHPLDVGMIGTYGNRWANKALAEADFLLVLGSRLDLRQLGSDASKALGGKRVFWVDIDPAEMEKHGARRGYNVDLRDFCNAVAPEGSSVNAFDPEKSHEPIGRFGWHRQIGMWRGRWPAETELQVPPGAIHPLVFLEELSSRLLDAAVSAVVTDVGAHQMWAAQAMRIPTGIRFITSGGHGAMGFGLPAAIGAAFSGPVVLVTGDASLLVNVQELATLAELRLPIKIVVLDNEGHGMVREFQDRYFEGRHVATTARAVGFLRVAWGLGIPLEGLGECAAPPFDEALRGLLEGDGPGLLRVPIDPTVGVAPRMVYGKGLAEMAPPRD